MVVGSRSSVPGGSSFSTVAEDSSYTEFNSANRNTQSKSIGQVANPDALDQGVIGNFMAARFNRQAHLNALLPAVHPALLHKPCTRVEGTRCSSRK